MLLGDVKFLGRGNMANQGIAMLLWLIFTQTMASGWKIRYREEGTGQKTTFFFFVGRVHQAQASYRPQNVCTWSKIRQGIRFWRQKASKSSKITENYEKTIPKPKNFDQQNFFGVEKSKVANRLKRVFPNFEAKRSHPRGANDRSKLPAVVPMLLRYLPFLPDCCTPSMPMLWWRGAVGGNP